MATQENIPFPGSDPTGPIRVPTLVEVTNQLANPNDELGPVQQPKAPAVVFVSSETCCDDIQESCQSDISSDLGVGDTFAASSIDCTTGEFAIGESCTEQLPAVAVAESIGEIQQPAVEQSVELQIQTLEQLTTGDDLMTGAWRHRWFYSDEARFLLDPFDQAIDGPIPVLTSLPVLKAIEMTENVVSRKQKGMHYAWRLKPGPYPDLGNMQVATKSDEAPPEPTLEVAAVEAEVETDTLEADVTETAATETAATEIAATETAATETAATETAATETAATETHSIDQSAWTPDLENWSPQKESWTQSEIVAEGDSVQQGDDFYAQPGDVISIDGNNGYDHIDLSSYALEDATFQPGAILLNSKVENEDGELEPPIIIRHRGIGFAIFGGDVRVQL